MSHRPIVSRADLLERISRYIVVDDATNEHAKQGVEQEYVQGFSAPTYVQQALPSQQAVYADHMQGQGHRTNNRNTGRGNNVKEFVGHKSNIPRPPRRVELPPLNCSLAYLVGAIKGQGFYEKPQKLSAPYQMSDPTKYCDFHEQKGHSTDQCYKLKELLDRLIKAGHLDRYIGGAGTSKAAEHNTGANVGPEIRKTCN